MDCCRKSKRSQGSQGSQGSKNRRQYRSFNEKFILEPWDISKLVNIFDHEIIFGTSKLLATRPREDTKILDLLKTSEREKICEFLQSNNILGKGSYGEIFKIDIEDQSVAIKRFTDVRASGRTTWFDDYPDVDIGSRLSHPNLCKTYLTVTNTLCPLVNSTLVFMELYDASLQRCIERNLIETIPLRDKTALFHGLILGLDFLHQCGILHLDIKTDNVLVKINYYGDITKLVLADFGMSKYVTLNNQCYYSPLPIGTTAYTMPECLIKPCQYNQESDIWSLGIVGLEFLMNYRVIKDILEQYKTYHIENIYSDSQCNDAYTVNYSTVKKYLIQMKGEPVDSGSPVFNLLNSMIGTITLKTDKIIDKHFITRDTYGQVLVENSVDLDPSKELEYLKALKLLSKYNDYNNQFYCAIHLIYMSYKYDYDIDTSSRVKYCRIMASGILGYDGTTREANFLKFRDSLLCVLNGSTRTFNLGDYICTKKDYETIGKYHTEPLKYFSRLAELTKDLPPRPTKNVEFYDSKYFSAL